MSIKMADKDSKEEIIKAFKLFDDNCTGKISFCNLKRIAQELGENIADEELQVETLVLFFITCFSLTYSHVRLFVMKS